MEGSTTSNVFAALALVAAPAVLTNAMSVLALGSGNRLARVQDRLRQTLQDLGEAAAADREGRMRQLDRLRTRARLLLNSMRAFFVALGSFAATTVLAVVGASFDILSQGSAARTFGVAALGIALFGVCNLLMGCLLLVRDTRLAVENLEDELRIQGVTEPTQPR